MNTNLKNFYEDDGIKFHFENIGQSTSMVLVFANSAKRFFVPTVLNTESNYFEFNTSQVVPLIAAGDYQVDARYTNSDGSFSEKVMDKITVLESVLTANPVIQSFNKKMFTALDDLLQNRIKVDYNSYTIGGRSITKMAPSEILSLRNYYYGQVLLEEATSGGKNSNNFMVNRYVGRR